MGRQVNFKLKDIRESVTMEIKADYFPEDDCGWLYVVMAFPNGKKATLDLFDIDIGKETLVSFDCRNIDTSTYGWVEQYLIDNNIPYTAG